MKQTTNYNLNKIELQDSPPDITVINPNWDKIDTEMKRLSDGLKNSDEAFTEHLASHVECHVVSQKERGENEPNYGLI